jgi:hypothetical protein
MILNILLSLNIMLYFAGFHEVFPIFGYGVTPWDLSALSIIFYSAKRLIWNGDRPKISRNKLYLGVLIFFAAMLLSTLHPIITGNRLYLIQVIKTSVHLLFYVIYFISYTLLDFKKKRVIYLLKSFLVIAFFTNIFAVYQLFARIYDLPLKFISFYNVANTTRGKLEDNEMIQLTLKFENFTRATSYMSEPSALAAANLVFLTIMFVPYLVGEKQLFKSKLFNTLNLIFSLIALLLTFSLSGVIGIAIFIATGFFIHKKLSFIKFLKGALIITLIIIVADIVAEKSFNTSVLELFGQRITSLLPFKNNKSEQIVGESYEHRIGTFQASFNIWKEYPITGIGLGLTSYHKEFELSFSDTSMMAVLGEAGIIGAIAFLLLFFYIFLYSYNYLKLKDEKIENDPEIRIIQAIPIYLFGYLFCTNFLVSNQIINTGFWEFFPIFTVMIFSIDNFRNKNLIEIKLVNEGLSTKLGNRFSKSVN